MSLPVLGTCLLKQVTGLDPDAAIMHRMQTPATTMLHAIIGTVSATLLASRRPSSVDIRAIVLATLLFHSENTRTFFLSETQV